MHDIEKIGESAKTSFPLIKSNALNKAYKKRILQEFTLKPKRKMMRYPPRQDNAFRKKRLRVPMSVQPSINKQFDILGMQKDEGLQMNKRGVNKNSKIALSHLLVIKMPKKVESIRQKVAYVPKNKASLHILHPRKNGN
jgi:hypothetical protein